MITVFRFLILGSILLAGCSSQSELEWNTADGYRWAELQPGYFGQTGFEPLSANRTNITFRNDVPAERARANRHYLNGSGVAAGDVNEDGLVDLYFARLEGPNQLYLNLGDFQFEDATAEAGLAHEGFNSTGATFADVNGNGHLDLIVTSLSDGNMLYLNDGQGRFERKTDSGLGESRGAMTPALADVDGDGLLDLYITNYKIQSARDRFSPQELVVENTVETVDGELRVLPPFDADYGIVQTTERPYRNEYGEADELYLNRGDGVFERVDDTEYFFDPAGNAIGLLRDWGLTAMFHDVTGDGHPDLYVANDFWTPDRFWINRGDGTFRAIDTTALRSMSFSSMAVDFSDINRDGLTDLAVSEMLSTEHETRMRQFSEHFPEYEGRTQDHRNSVYLNRGDHTFAQIAHYTGLEASEWSWATYFTDVDLDGYEDLIFTTGFMNDYLDIDTQIAMGELNSQGAHGGDILGYPALYVPNKIFQNNGDLTFTDKSEDWGFTVADLSTGMALADLDNNGVLDLVISRLNDEAVLYQNTTHAPRIAVRLNGEAPNTQGIGARIELEGGPVVQTKEIAAGGRYLSGAQAQATFAADEHNDDHTLTVTWPDGRQSRITGVQANRIYEIDQSAAIHVEEVETLEAKRYSPLFKDVSERIGHVHHENVYDDFRFHPLLPLRLSRLGPGVAWLDFDDDDDEDLFVTSGKGSELALFENRGDGRFEAAEREPLTQVAPGDQTTVLGWKEEGRTKIVVGSANYEQGDPTVPSAYVYSIGTDGSIATTPLPGILSTTGPMAAADYSGDGSIDLFVGGRFMPGQYPRDARSRLFRNVEGTYQLDEANSRLLAEAGLVTGSVFTDFDGNGAQDLLISTEWGSLRLFENQNGTFREVTAEMGLDTYRGWWNGVATGDFTNDGRPDIVATNLGTNSPYRVDARYPLRMYYDVFPLSGRSNIVEAYYDEDRGAYLPLRKLHDFGSMPRVLTKVQSHRAFAEATVNDLFEIDADTPSREINTLEHMLFINTGEGFRAHPLPPEAQFTAAFHAGIADVDNDGNEDLFLSHNFFALPQHIPRLDAGRGLVLKGDGTGNLRPLPATESGIYVYSEQRGAAFGDFDRDGRVDLAVSQHGGETRLYRNQADSSGIRVRLIGPETNRDAIGSSLRIVYTDGTTGPRREIQAGSGYWSQNSAMQVMGINGDPDHIEVTWFDGSTTSTPIIPAQTEYRISYPNP